MPSQTARSLVGSSPQLGSPDDIFAYGQGIPKDATWRNLIPAAEFGLSVAPGSGEAMSLYDAWKSSGQGGEALMRGDYGQAASNYGDLATALVGAIPGAGIVARGTKRGAAWMDKNLPEGFNRLLDAVYPSDPGSTTNIFAGPTAKTADQAALSQAQELATQGASRDDIWNQTGWFQGVDGKWRFEIDDSAAQLSGVKPDKAGLFQTSKSGSFTGLDHPEYSAAYGDVPKMYGKYGPGVETRGAYMGDPSGQGPPYVQAQGVDPSDARSVALHELQHVTQRPEGFAAGGNWRAMLELPEARNAVAARVQQMRASGANLSEEDMISNAEVEVARGLYHRLAGETEARNVQRRRKFSAEDRRATPPWETQDVPDDQQIVRFGNQGPAYSLNSRPLSLKLTSQTQVDKGFVGGVESAFDIMDGETSVGKIYGGLTDPHTFKIDWMQGTGGESANSMGPTAIRSLIQGIKEQFPEVRQIVGERGMGARKGTEKAYETVRIPVR